MLVVAQIDWERRNALVQQRESALKAALGAGRYTEFVQLQDPAYRDAFAAAQDAGDPEAVQSLYQINLAAAQQMASIRANTNLTPEQLAVERSRVELEQAKANALALGQEITPAPAPPATNAPPPVPTIRSHSYVLGAGESAANIATTFGVTLDAIQTANPGVNLRRLKSGDTLQVPDSLQGH